ncbi:TWiK family of potassium channels protein 7-like [Asterias rubens]|uniref:TWiK family of potassium channels protein 7-like n=1 Tax=Asterias rubens TaxID=7604 RepID=UPI0014554D23|nr:TWiK family of potassium channels protein 7-like [Asterias rubens]
MSDDEGVGSGLSYSVLEDDTETRAPSYNRSSFMNSGLASNRSTSLSGCLRASVPHLIIVSVYLVYLLGGGGVFLAIYRAQEAPIQAALQTEEAKYEEAKVKITEAIESYDVHGLSEKLELFMKLTEEQNSDYLKIEAGPELTYMRSVVYCLTTITTIGYGDYVPMTTLGKALTVFYALVGIPLTLLFLIDMGSLLARLLDTLVSKCRCRQIMNSYRQSNIYKNTSEPVGDDQQRDGDGETRENYWRDTAWGRRNVPIYVIVVVWLVFFFMASVFIATIEKWSYEEGLFFTITTVTTIGFGDIVPVRFHTDVPSFFACLVHILATLSVMSMCFILTLPKILKLIAKIDAKVNF